MRSSQALEFMRMDRYEREIARLFVAWAPYGGPREDELSARFGVSVERAMEILGCIVCDAQWYRWSESDRMIVVELVNSLRMCSISRFRRHFQ